MSFTFIGILLQASSRQWTKLKVKLKGEKWNNRIFVLKFKVVLNRVKYLVDWYLKVHEECNSWVKVNIMLIYSTCFRSKQVINIICTVKKLPLVLKLLKLRLYKDSRNLWSFPVFFDIHRGFSKFQEYLSNTKVNYAKKLWVF